MWLTYVIRTSNQWDRRDHECVMLDYRYPW